MSSHPVSEPTEPGWYVTRDRVNDWMLYARDTFGNWSAHTLAGDSTDCLWPYIEQAGPVRLVLPYPRPESEEKAHA